MSIRKSSNKSFINKLSDRLQKLEVDRAIGADHNHDDNYDPELAEIQARYAKYAEQGSEEWRLTFEEYSEYLTQFGGPEERYRLQRKNFHWHCKDDALPECTPECKYYHEKGRIEDEEVIVAIEEFHKKKPWYREYLKYRKYYPQPPNYLEAYGTTSVEDVEYNHYRKYSYIKGPQYDYF